MSTIKKYLSLVKFAHTIFALPFAMIGFALGVKAVYQQHIVVGEIVLKLLLVLVCMVSARSAAMAFNRYLDRHFDAKNPRTAIREIPRGIISPGSALRFTIINCVIFIIATYFINSLCFVLSPVALFVILFYSYTKRFTALCHLVLGLGLSLAPIGAYLAVTGVFNLLPILFSIAVITWVSGFDIIYAMQDVDFDNSEKLHSIPTFLGKTNALHTSEFLHLISAASVVFAGVYGHFGFLYWLGIAVFMGMLVYQHLLVRPNDLSKVDIAFMTANGIASIVFGILVIADVIIF
ncbi:UbiA-like polyprenyltransferase [Arachidicoccus soli]|uniref:4-hydroxybenzoate polyprenyltransferase n=1 Tax=Arachidicoccus soli TaxID=2341117 RepID=A0A386HR55_9BACT|nr:UbiA-like polyprenyltransferase [Arachidicoccus soli]AYD48129.1 4-hydroxybenzoate octaprenyltransferase [Arachidicoccus soli]